MGWEEPGLKRVFYLSATPNPRGSECRCRIFTCRRVEACAQHHNCLRRVHSHTNDLFTCAVCHAVLRCVVQSTCCACSYRVASVRTLPQVPAGSMDYTTFSWNPLLARLKGMCMSGAWRGVLARVC